MENKKFNTMFNLTKVTVGAILALVAVCATYYTILAIKGENGASSAQLDMISLITYMSAMASTGFFLAVYLFEFFRYLLFFLFCSKKKGEESKRSQK